MKTSRTVMPAFAVMSLVAAACGSFSSGETASSGNDAAVGNSGGDSTSTSGGTDIGSGGGGATSSVTGGSMDTSGSVDGSTSNGGADSSGTTAPEDAGASGSTTGGVGSGTTVGGTNGSGTTGRTTTGGTNGGSGTTGRTTTGGTNGGNPGSTTGGMTGGTTGGTTGGMTVCAVLGAAGNTCVAAHSTVRVLYPGYTGPLYQVCKGSSAPGPNSCPGGNTKDIGAVNGFADAASQDSFCAGGTCTISAIYDQTPNANHLKPAPAGGAIRNPDNPANATDLKTTISGHMVYGVLIKPGMGYRAGCTGCASPTAKGTAVLDQPETEYMVTSGQQLVDGCCFDYGNAETSAHDDGNGTMEAVYFGGGVVWGTGSPGGHNNGPWVMADLENGLYAGWENNQDQDISTNTPLRSNFVTAVVVGDVASQNGGKGRFALYGGDATTGALKTMYDGIRPAKSGYVPMKKQGSIILGIGGDNSNGDGGRFYEGVMASGAATVATVNALQANIVAAGYGK